MGPVFQTFFAAWTRRLALRRRASEPGIFSAIIRLAVLLPHSFFLQIISDYLCMDPPPCRARAGGADFSAVRPTLCTQLVCLLGFPRPMPSSMPANSCCLASSMLDQSRPMTCQYSSSANVSHVGVTGCTRFGSDMMCFVSECVTCRCHGL